MTAPAPTAPDQPSPLEPGDVVGLKRPGSTTRARVVTMDGAVVELDLIGRRRRGLRARRDIRLLATIGKARWRGTIDQVEEVDNTVQLRIRLQETDEEERRDEPRVGAELPIAALVLPSSTDTAPVSATGCTADLSTRGLRAELDIELCAGTNTALRVEMPDGVIVALASVVGVTRESDRENAPYITRFNFSQMQADDLQRLNAFVCQLFAGRSGTDITPTFQPVERTQHTTASGMPILIGQDEVGATAAGLITTSTTGEMSIELLDQIGTHLVPGEVAVITCSQDGFGRGTAHLDSVADGTLQISSSQTDFFDAASLCNPLPATLSIIQDTGLVASACMVKVLGPRFVQIQSDQPLAAGDTVVVDLPLARPARLLGSVVTVDGEQATIAVVGDRETHELIAVFVADEIVTEQRGVTPQIGVWDFVPAAV